MTTETVPLRENISPRTEKWIRLSAVLAMIIVATSSAVLSFDGLKKVALEAKIPEHLAFLFPIAVDTTILMGSLAVLLYELFGVRAVFGWVTVLFGTFLSIVGNVISVKDAGLIAQVLHGIIPVLLCISLESLLRILRFNIKRTRLARSSLPHLEPEFSNDEEPKQTLNTAPANVAVPEPRAEAPNPVLAPARLESEPNVEKPVVTVSDAVQPVPAPSVDIYEGTPKPVEEARVVPDKTASMAPVVEPEPEVIEPGSVAPVKATPELTPEVKPIESAADKDEPAVKPQPAKRPAAKTSKGSKHSEENVAKYKAILDEFPEDTPKARKVAEILRAYSDASAADIKATLGDPPELRIDGTISRAREWLKKN
jgi:hypothetical protein